MKLYLDYRQYTTELYDYGKSIVAYYYCIFPNMMFNFYPWGLSINIVKPIFIDKKSYFFLKLSVNREQGTHHFHRLLAKFLRQNQ